jgi:hypothetical protein
MILMKVPSLMCATMSILPRGLHTWAASSGVGWIGSAAMRASEVALVRGSSKWMTAPREEAPHDLPVVCFSPGR